MKTIIKILPLLFFVTILNSCKRDKDIVPEKVSLDINIGYSIDDLPLIVDSIMYTNAAGNVYEITRLEYYISNIVLHLANGENYVSRDIFYLNAMEPNTNILNLKNVPTGKYSYLTFNIGIDSTQNISYYLSNTSENINMIWPSYMGGGYHFLKMEGHFNYASGTTGYAVHLGKNSSLVSCSINSEFTIDHAPYQIEMVMNINEWYKTPYTYDLATDGSFTMGDMVAMGKIAANGANVFSLKNN